MSTYSRMRLAAVAAAAVAKSADPTRRKCFISYHHADQEEVEDFINSFGHVFIPRVLGVSDEDDFIDSTDTDYVMERIRERYLQDSTVTIVLVGECTWARRYVDWEVYSTLRDSKKDKRNGLMAITLPSIANNDSRRLPQRVADNVDGDKLYARWWKYPTSADSLRNCIEIAFRDRTEKAHLIVPAAPRRIISSACP